MSSFSGWFRTKRSLIALARSRFKTGCWNFQSSFRIVSSFFYSLIMQLQVACKSKCFVSLVRLPLLSNPSLSNLSPSNLSVSYSCYFYVCLFITHISRLSSRKCSTRRRPIWISGRSFLTKSIKKCGKFNKNLAILPFFRTNLGRLW